jgi:exosome complex component RRP45
MLALLAALKSTFLPEITVTPTGEATISSEVKDRTISINMLHLPISTTFGIFEEFVFADPNLEEEGLLTGSLNVVYDERGNLCSLSKPGGTTLTDAQMKQCMQIAKERVSPLLGLINKAVENWSSKR